MDSHPPDHNLSFYQNPFGVSLRWASARGWMHNKVDSSYLTSCKKSRRRLKRRSFFVILGVLVAASVFILFAPVATLFKQQFPCPANPQQTLTITLYSSISCYVVRAGYSISNYSISQCRTRQISNQTLVDFTVRLLLVESGAVVDCGILVS